jgi:hypothetical protein
MKLFWSIAQLLKRKENVIKNYYYRERKKDHEKESQKVCQEVETSFNDNFKLASSNEIKSEENFSQDEELMNWLEGQENMFDMIN